ASGATTGGPASGAAAGTACASARRCTRRRSPSWWRPSSGRARSASGDVMAVAQVTVRFGTYNLLDLFGADTVEHQRHYETVAGVIRELDADVLAVQEILAPDAGTAARRLRQLACDAGLGCEVLGADGEAEAAIAVGV